MRIAIATEKEKGNIITVKEYEPIFSKGEVAHFLAEIEIIKQELLELWKDVADWEE